MSEIQIVVLLGRWVKPISMGDCSSRPRPDWGATSILDGIFDDVEPSVSIQKEGEGEKRTKENFQALGFVDWPAKDFKKSTRHIGTVPIGFMLGGPWVC